MTKIKNEEIFQTLAVRLRAQRIKKGITVEQLAEQANIPLSKLRAIDKGERRNLTADHLVRLSVYFDVKVDYLLGRRDTEK